MLFLQDEVASRSKASGGSRACGRLPLGGVRLQLRGLPIVLCVVISWECTRYILLLLVQSGRTSLLRCHAVQKSAGIMP